MATSKILDGKALAAELRAEMATEVKAAVAGGARPPGLAVVMAGDNAASQVYVRNKQRACSETGIVSIPFLLPGNTTTQEILELVEKLNVRPDVDAILIQLPLPDGIDARTCLDAIDPEKDVDGFSPVNMGRLALGLDSYVPCTPQGVMELLRRNNIETAGKKAVIAGRSDIVGKPLALLLSAKDANATVTICHSRTPDLKKECLAADLLFLAMGKPSLVKADMIRDGCVVIDIGINRTDAGLSGDADFAEVSRKAAAITPVPGGVGPMTIAMLLRNTLKSWRKRVGESAN